MINKRLLPTWPNIHDRQNTSIPPLQLKGISDGSPGWNHTHHCVLFGSCDQQHSSCTFRYSETYGCEFVLYSTAINAGVALVFIVISIARVIMAFEWAIRGSMCVHTQWAGPVVETRVTQILSLVIESPLYHLRQSIACIRLHVCASFCNKMTGGYWGRQSQLKWFPLFVLMQWEMLLALLVFGGSALNRRVLNCLPATLAHRPKHALTKRVAISANRMLLSS